MSVLSLSVFNEFNSSSHNEAKGSKDGVTLTFNQTDVLAWLDRICQLYVLRARSPTASAPALPPCPEWLVIEKTPGSLMHPFIGYIWTANLAEQHRCDAWYVLTTRQIIVSPLRRLTPEEATTRAELLRRAAHALDDTVLKDERSLASLRIGPQVRLSDGEDPAVPFHYSDALPMLLARELGSSPTPPK